jgi:cell division protein FtsL
MSRTHFVLLLALIFSCLALVQTSYESRRLFDETNRARDELARLDAEAQRLEAERQAQATHLRVEKVAREKLAMRAVTAYISPYSAKFGTLRDDDVCASSGSCATLTVKDPGAAVLDPE